MIKEICIIGQPSLVGGADTELLDQCICWKKMDLKIYILPTHPLNSLQLELAKRFDWTILKLRMWMECKGMHVISFCNKDFLDFLPEIKKYCKTSTFVNCMTWNFPKEIELQARGLIDFHLYQSDHGMQKVSINLRHLKPFRPIRFDPYFNVEVFSYHSNRPMDHFRYGRISRPDKKKFNVDQFKVYREFVSPVPKSGVILGWGPQLAEKFKKEDIPPTIQLIKAGGTPAPQFYKFCDVMCSQNETFENLPRVGFESMASGSVMVVDNRGGWKMQVEDKVTGFLCNTTQEFIDSMTFLANNTDRKEEMRAKAKEKLEKEWGFEKSAKSWENVFNEWEKLKK